MGVGGDTQHGFGLRCLMHPDVEHICFCICRGLGRARSSQGPRRAQGPTRAQGKTQGRAQGRAH